MDKTPTNTLSPTNLDIKDEKIVRIYRLNKLEENQELLLDKLNEINNKLDTNYQKHMEHISKCKSRVEALEKRAKTVDKIIWLLVGATVTELVALVFWTVTHSITIL